MQCGEWMRPSFIHRSLSLPCYQPFVLHGPYYRPLLLSGPFYQPFLLPRPCYRPFLLYGHYYRPFLLPGPATSLFFPLHGPCYRSFLLPGLLSSTHGWSLALIWLRWPNLFINGPLPRPLPLIGPSLIYRPLSPTGLLSPMKYQSFPAIKHIIMPAYSNWTCELLRNIRFTTDSPEYTQVYLLH